MAKLIIKNTDHPDLNGEYDIDLAGGFTKAEYFVMKKHVDVVVGDMVPGAKIDQNVMTGWGLVALRRAGKEHLFPLYMDTTDEQTEWSFDEAEVEDAGPPASKTGSDESSSGLSTRNGSESSLETTPLPIGDRI
jgi:hypothetical protein